MSGKKNKISEISEYKNIFSLTLLINVLQILSFVEADVHNLYHVEMFSGLSGPHKQMSEQINFKLIKLNLCQCQFHTDFVNQKAWSSDTGLNGSAEREVAVKLPKF